MDGSPLGELESPHGSGFTSGADASTESGSVIRWQPTPGTGSGSGPHAAAAPAAAAVAAGVAPTPGAAASGGSSAAATAGRSGWHAAPSGALGSAAVASEEWSPPVHSQQHGEVTDEEALIGVVLGDRYRVDELIGSGGMGLVYKATHQLIGRELAIKVLRRRYAEQDDVAQRFAQEARVASSVKHANVVDVIDYGTTPRGSPYCVMEYLAGRSLARELADVGALEPRRALNVAIQVARGLAAAHQAGIVHRDLKPDNVFVVPADEHAPEQIKILDFGIARVAGRRTRLTKSGAVVGTPEYMSPEQARGDDLDARSDLYALGVVLFEALTGQVPLTAESTVGTLTKQVFELPPRLRDMHPKFVGFPSVEAALGRLLAKNRDERPSTALDAARLIQTAAANDIEPSDDNQGQAALAGWSHPNAMAVSAHDLAKRSTIMIGSGSVSRAHDVAADGPATGSFSAKDTKKDEESLAKQPSIIVREPVPPREGPDGRVRPTRLVGVETPPAVTPISASSAPAPPPPVSKTPTPDSNRPLGKPPRGGIGRRHLPLILIGVGAAIFAALVTIGFVRWLQRREGRTSELDGVKGSTVEWRWAARERGLEHPNPPARGRRGVFGPSTAPNTPVRAQVERPARVLSPSANPDHHLRPVTPTIGSPSPASASSTTLDHSQAGENAVG